MTYTLDLNAGLTQVLSDGTEAYLYGAGRIALENTTTEYFLGDALGSVRQLADAGGAVTLSQDYQPYGEVLNSAGEGTTAYGFTGEQTDPTGLVYLRARYYSPYQGRFLTRDMWEGDANSPMSYNAWLYGYTDPIRYTDPSGHYNRLAAVNYAMRFDQGPSTMDIYDVTQLGWSDCASFVSRALWEGGIRDPRPDPRDPGNSNYYRDPTHLVPDPEDQNKLKIPYWSRDTMMGSTPFGDHPELLQNEWYRTDPLLNYLTAYGLAVELPAYTGTVPQFRHDIDNGNRNNPAWLEYLKSNVSIIQPGDLVFYKMLNGGYGGYAWDHVAMVVDWEWQTYRGADGQDPWEIVAHHAYHGWFHDFFGCDANQFDHHEGKPRVVERGLDGLVYGFSRSIDNTLTPIAHIQIVHIR